ncbi:MAG: NAD(P)H-hydrate epimerase [Candidatus Omnitrophota bacterium]|jgi:NAD(P)H-hydrate epimerase
MRPNGVTAQDMSEIDRRAQEEYGIPQAVLMENAGRAVAEAILSETPSIKDEKIACFCGKGNNGGDGFVLARLLAKELPARLTVYVSGAEKMKEGAARDNFLAAKEMKIEIKPFKDFLSPGTGPDEYTISVDAIFGTGFKGELPEEYKALGKALNASSLKKYAVDIPSGLDSTTGIASEDCLRADKTITFGLSKQGFFLENGPKVCGEIIIRNVGFPEMLLNEYM